jgi:type IV pilus assembly protein PilO
MKFAGRELIFVAAMIGLLAAAYFLGFAKQDARRTAKQVEIDRKVKVLADLERSTSSVRDVEKKIRELQQATSFFESKLPQAKEIDKILKEVWQLAEAHSLTTKTVKTLKSQRMNGYSEQPIEMSLSGDFNGFYDFLLNLERLPRLTRITQMNLNKLAEHDGEMQAQLTLTIFFEPETDQTAAAY